MRKLCLSTYIESFLRSIHGLQLLVDVNGYTYMQSVEVQMRGRGSKTLSERELVVWVPAVGTRPSGAQGL